MSSNRPSINDGVDSENALLFTNRLRQSSYRAADNAPAPIPVYKQKGKVLPCLLVLLGIFLLTIMSVTIAKNKTIVDREQTYESLTQDNAQKPD